MPVLQPTSVELDPDARELTITWTTGEATKHDYTVLRKLCPCASCRTEREKVKTMKGLRIIQGPAAPTLEPKIARVEPVGRYALRFDWDDGHSAGIYTFDFLRQNQKPT